MGREVEGRGEKGIQEGMNSISKCYLNKRHFKKSHENLLLENLSKR